MSEAYVLFAEQGYEGTSLAGLAEQLKVSKPALYYYFNSKESLFEALYESICELILIDLKKISSCSTSLLFEDLLYELGMNDFKGLAEAPQLAKVLRQFDLLSFRMPSIAEKAKALELETQTVYDQIVEAGIQAGRLKASEREVFKRLLLAVINGLSYEQITTGRSVSETEWRYMIEKLLN